MVSTYLGIFIHCPTQLKFQLVFAVHLATATVVDTKDDILRRA